MQTILNAVQMNDLTGDITDSTKTNFAGIVLTSALVGSLTITGITTSTGAAQVWTMNAGATGWQACPGSAKSFGLVAFSYTNAADEGNAYAIYQPL